MKVQIPILNKASGRSGDTIFQSYYGNTYTRSMPLLFHYPDTPNQQATQATFFDLQRIWIPIYNQLSLSIQQMQRKNKNPFNVMSSFVYKIFHPYSNDKKERYPSNFGLDRLNRVRPYLMSANLRVEFLDITFFYDMNRPINQMGFPMTDFNVLLFNITKQSMLFMQTPIVAGEQEISFHNTNEWSAKDKIVVYGSLSCSSWLGNFNLIGRW